MTTQNYWSVVLICIIAALMVSSLALGQYNVWDYYPTSNAQLDDTFFEDTIPELISPSPQQWVDKNQLSKTTLTELTYFGQLLNQTTDYKTIQKNLTNRYTPLVNSYLQKKVIDSYTQFVNSFFDRAQTNVVLDEDWHIKGYEFDYLLSILDFDQLFFFNQVGLLSNHFSTYQASWGVGFRYLSENFKGIFSYISPITPIIWGFNTFIDYMPNIGHMRYSIGTELAKPGIKLTTNRYFPISDFISQNSKYYLSAKPADGYDVNLIGYLTALPEFFVTYSHFEWSSKQGKVDPSGKMHMPPYVVNWEDKLSSRASGSKASLTWNPIPLLGGSVSFARDQNKYEEIEGKINFSLRTDKSLSQQLHNIKPKEKPMTLRLNFDFVERNKRMVLAFRDDRLRMLLKWDDADSQAGIVTHNTQLAGTPKFIRTASIATTSFPSGYTPSKIQYAISDPANTIATINSATAEVEVLDIGYATVEAIYPADNYYAKSKIQYLLKSKTLAKLDVPTCEYDDYITGTVLPCKDLTTQPPGSFIIIAGVNYRLKVKSLTPYTKNISFILDPTNLGKPPELSLNKLGDGTTAAVTTTDIMYNVKQDDDDLYDKYVSSDYFLAVERTKMDIQWDDADAQAGTVKASVTQKTITRTASAIPPLPPGYKPKTQYSLVNPLTGIVTIDSDTGELTLLASGTTDIQAQHLTDGVTTASSIIQYTLVLTSQSLMGPPRCFYESNVTSTVRDCDQNPASTSASPLFDLYNGIQYTLESDSLTSNSNPEKYVLTPASLNPSNSLTLNTSGTGHTDVLNKGMVEYIITQGASLTHDKYQSGPYNLTIKKDDVKLLWDDPNIQATGQLTVKLSSGTTTQTFSADYLNTHVEIDVLDKDKQYTIENENPPGLATIDKTTGKIILINLGTATIKGLLRNHPVYNDTETSFQLTIGEDKKELGCKYTPRRMSTSDSCINECEVDPTDANHLIFYASGAHWHLHPTDTSREYIISSSTPPHALIARTDYTSCFKSDVTGTAVLVEKSDPKDIVNVTILKNTLDLKWIDSDAQAGAVDGTGQTSITREAKISTNLDNYPWGYNPKDSDIIYRLKSPSTTVSIPDKHKGKVVITGTGTAEIEAVYLEDDFTKQSNIIGYTLEQKQLPDLGDLACMYTINSDATIVDCTADCEIDPADPRSFIFYAHGAHWHLLHGDTKIIKPSTPNNAVEPVLTSTGVYTTGPASSIKAELEDSGGIGTFYIQVKKNKIDIEWEDADAKAGSVDGTGKTEITRNAKISSDLNTYPWSYDPKDSEIIYRLKNPSSFASISDPHSGTISIAGMGTAEIEALYLEDDFTEQSNIISYTLKNNPPPNLDDLDCQYTINDAKNVDDCTINCEIDSTDPQNFIFYANGAHWHLKHGYATIKKPSTPDTAVTAIAGSFNFYSTGPASSARAELEGSGDFGKFYITVKKNKIDIQWEDADAKAGLVDATGESNITRKAKISSDLGKYPWGYNPQDSKIIYRLKSPSTIANISDKHNGTVSLTGTGTAEIEAVYPEDSYTKESNIISYTLEAK